MNASASPETSAIADVVVSTASRPSFYVPLHCLRLSSDQVRHTPPSAQGIAEMAAMLLSQGQLHALHVTQGDDATQFVVCAGGRRLRALQLLASQGKVPSDYAVECKRVDEEEAVAVGLMENISQEAMHPADEFLAFQTLAGSGRSIESIATQYGATVLHVQRRLKLASLAPELLKLYRKGELQLDQVMALVALDDPKRQWMLYRSLTLHSRSAHNIRRLIAQDEVSEKDRRVLLVGLSVYRAAGGGIRQDLFSETSEQFLTDPLLLDMLVAEAFEKQAAGLRAQGWKWIDVLPEFNYNERNQYFEMPVKRLPESPVHMAKRLTLEAELAKVQDQLVALDDDQDANEASVCALEKQIDGLESQLEALAGQLVDTRATDKDLAGVVLTLEGSKIKRLVNMGRVSERKQIMAALAARQQNASGSTPAAPDLGGVPSAGSPSDGIPSRSADPMDTGIDTQSTTIPERLMLNLTSHRTAALQASLLGQQKVTLAALAMHMAFGLFDSLAVHNSPLKISCSNPWYVLERHSPTVGTSPAAKALAEERARWTNQLPEDRSEWLQWFIEQPLELTLSMIVLGTAHTLDAVKTQIHHQDPGRALAQALNLDMVQWWSPTPENYLSLVPKAQLVEAVSEAQGAQKAQEIAKLKKAEAIAFSDKALAGTGWLPLPLRGA
jgi:ParB family chromosome partitioning protein